MVQDVIVRSARGISPRGSTKFQGRSLVPRTRTGGESERKSRQDAIAEATKEEERTG